MITAKYVLLDSDSAAVIHRVRTSTLRRDRKEQRRESVSTALRSWFAGT